MKIHLSFFFILLFCFTSFGQTQTGKASFYAKKFAGRTTANGEKFNPRNYTAAHRNLPFNSKVLVTNLANNKSIVVRINDRGPFVSGRIIDLAPAAAERLDFINAGVTDVIIKVVDKETPVGSDSIVPKIADTDQNKELGKPIADTTHLDQTIEAEFYSIKVDSSNPVGYGVQIGSFEESINLFRLSNKLEASYNKKITVELKHIDKTKVYSIILGDFGTREKAENFMKKVKEKYPDSFIIKFSETK